MRIIKPYVEILTPVNYGNTLRKLEMYGRVCYKSESLITDDSAESFCRNIIANGHESVLEHESVSARVVCDRGISHEIVRHRIASYSQESTRYCNYSKNKFGSEITVIQPCYLEEGTSGWTRWRYVCQVAEKEYFGLLNEGYGPQEARAVLPTSLKTEIVMTMNLREWRHFLRLRTSPKAHPQMREIANMIFAEFYSKLPVFVEDIPVPEELKQLIPETSRATSFGTNAFDLEPIGFKPARGWE